MIVMSDYPVRCPDCRKTPRNCTCYEYRVIKVEDSLWWVMVDAVATEPVRGQEARTWQARRNARIWRAPTYVDEYGPICYINDEALLAEINDKIKNRTFFVLDYEKREGCRVRKFERDLLRRLPFLRRPRGKRGDEAYGKVLSDAA